MISLVGWQKLVSLHLLLRLLLLAKPGSHSAAAKPCHDQLRQPTGSLLSLIQTIMSFSFIGGYQHGGHVKQSVSNINCFHGTVEYSRYKQAAEPWCGVLQLKDDTARVEEEEAEKKVKLKAMREHHHKWEDTREGRVGTWRDFVKGKKTRVSLACLDRPCFLQLVCHCAMLS